MNRSTRGLAVATFAGAAGLLLGMTPAAAAPVTASTTVDVGHVGQGNASASFGRLVLAPTNRGYQGSLQVTVKNEGTEAGAFRLRFQEPVGGSYDTFVTEPFCQPDFGSAGSRLTYECSLSGIAPKSSQTVHLKFRALTKTRPYAMQVAGGRIAVADDFGVPYSRWGNFATLFRSSTGSPHNPRTYRQDTVAKASITLADDEATLVRQSNSRFEGRLRATVRYDGDAAHNRLSIAATAPGVRFVGTDPVTIACRDTCDVPGGSFMQGEERTFDLLFEAPADAEPGVVRASGHLETRWEGTGVVPEKTPANNNLSFGIDISGPAMPPAGFTTLGIAATDLVYGPADGSGSRTGSTTVTITNTGDATAAIPMITFPVDGENQDWSATWPCPRVLNAPDQVRCISEPLLPGASRAVTFMFSTGSAIPSGPVTVRVDAASDQEGTAMPGSGAETTYQVRFGS